MRREKDKGTSDDTERMVALFKALADPSRLRLVLLLAGCLHPAEKGEPCRGGLLCVNALASKLRMTQSAVSQHLRVLRSAGLVRGERRGAFVHYAVELDEVEGVLQSLRGSLGISRRRD